MSRFWKYGLVAAFTFVIATATVVLAPDVRGAPKSSGPQLFTLLDREDVGATETITSDYVNVEGFSEFKVFYQWHKTLAKGKVEFRLVESIDGIRDTFGNIAVADNGSGGGDRSRVLSNPPYLNLRASVVNNTSGDVTAETQNVSVFLYAVR